MHSLALLLKSYAGDLLYAHRLLASIDEFNADSIPVYVVVPTEDVAAFKAIPAANTTVVSEAGLARHFVEDAVHGMRPGYINQEIVKLSFWELGYAENYFCVDSDAEFIRPFHVSDFMADGETPFTVLVEDNELKVEPRYYHQYWQQRDLEIRHIQRLVGLDDPIVRTCHGHQVMSGRVLRSFVDNYLMPRGWTYADALKEAPYEFSWYCMWLQKDRTIELHAREPLVKVFHHEGQHLEYLLRGIVVDDIARGYLAVVINSNYSRDLGVGDSSATKPEQVGRYLSYGELAKALRYKLHDTYRRRVSRRSA